MESRDPSLTLPPDGTLGVDCGLLFIHMQNHLYAQILVFSFVPGTA